MPKFAVTPPQNQLECPKCAASYSLGVIQHGARNICIHCGTDFLALLFPAIMNESPAASTADQLVVSDEASCYHHPEKRAASVCGQCGRFLCSLCDIGIGGKHLCASCLEYGRSSGQVNEAQLFCTLHDQVALSLSVLPLLVWPVTIFTSPIALYLTIKYWKKPISILPRTRVRFIFAFAFSALQIVGWLFGLTYFLSDFV